MESEMNKSLSKPPEKKLNCGKIYTEQELIEAFLPQPAEEIADPTKPDTAPDTEELKDALSHIPSADYQIWFNSQLFPSFK